MWRAWTCGITRSSGRSSGSTRAGQDQGIFGAPGRQAQIDATRAQAGRTAMSQETHHPGFSRVFVNENAQPVQNRTGYYSGQ